MSPGEFAEGSAGVHFCARHPLLYLRFQKRDTGETEKNPLARKPGRGYAEEVQQAFPVDGDGDLKRKKADAVKTLPKESAAAFNQ